MWAPRTFRARVNHYGAHALPRSKALHDLARGAAVCTENSIRANVTVTRNDVADRIAERGIRVISFMGGEQVSIIVNEQPEEIIKPNL
jgi:hypothetical protein